MSAKTTKESKIEEPGLVSPVVGLPKNFRSQPDIESFFRFVYENDLREEALEILTDVQSQKAAKKLVKN